MDDDIIDLAPQVYIKVDKKKNTVALCSELGKKGPFPKLCFFSFTNIEVPETPFLIFSSFEIGSHNVALVDRVALDSIC